MSITNTFSAKVAVGVVAAAMLFSVAFVPAQAQTVSELQAQINSLLATIATLQGGMSSGSTSSACPYTWTRVLSQGATGADVMTLQKFLNSDAETRVAASGAGSPGMETSTFGPATAAAVSKFQVKYRADILTPLGLVNPTGTFGSATMAKANALCKTGGSTSGGGTSTGGLSGGEADLRDYALKAEDSTGDEGESDVEIATAEFDVEDGDVEIERVEITFGAASTTLDDRPWQYFDEISVWFDGKKVGDIDASDRDEWDDDDGTSTITISGLNIKIEEGEKAELTIGAEIAETIDEDDQAQEFHVFIDDEGIRAVDGEGINQYIGDDTDQVDFGFGAEENGDLTIKSNSDDPDSSILVGDEDDESDEYTVFVFDIDNEEDVDSIITDLTIDVTAAGGASIDDIQSATLTVDGDELDGDITSTDIQFDDADIEIGGDERLTFELAVTLRQDPSAGTFVFDIDSATDVDAEGADSGDEADVSGSQTSETHTVALNGIAVEPVSTESDVEVTNTVDNSFGTFTIKFDVTAIDDDIFIPNTTASSSASSTAGVVYTDDVGGSGTFAGASGGGSTAGLSGPDLSAGYFQVSEGDTETFTLTVSLNPSSTGFYAVGLDKIHFNTTPSTSGMTTFEVDEQDEDYKTDDENIPS